MVCSSNLTAAGHVVDLAAIMDHAVVAEALTEEYQRPKRLTSDGRAQNIQAVTDVSLLIPRGELIGLLGLNGAGKTTPLKMLFTPIKPSTGSASVGGMDLWNARAIRTMTGLVVSDERSFYWRLSVRRNLQFFAALHGLYGRRAWLRIDASLGHVGLEDRAVLPLLPVCQTSSVTFTIRLVCFPNGRRTSRG
jgi:ABC-2 type transport system ATP-binding protein